MKNKMLNLDDLALTLDDEKDVLDIREVSNKEIAIIGVSIKAPMANDLMEFEDNLRKGKNCVGEFPESRKRDAEDYLQFKYGTGYSHGYLNGAYISEIDKFDYNFFKMTPKEASLMNPVQRLFLETAWEAIEDAGYGGKKIASSNTGVYLGFISDVEGYKYKEMLLDLESTQNLQISMTGNLSSIIPSRISYLLDLKGPSMLLDTACSSSLVGMHLACRALRNGDCEMAIAGGIRISLMPLDNQIKIGMESSDGIARTFDDASDGTGVGEGVIALLLKPLRKAKEDRDNIYAVIKGSAINQDGTSMGITAPNAKAQTDVIIKAWKDAGIDPETISYIEAHGTGTKLGDPIEIDGIENAFRRYTDKRQFCAISSVKTNIGHLYEASGLAGVVKAILCLKNKELIPGINFNTPNHRINFIESPVYVNDKVTKWETNGYQRRCGVSSFGFSGTNCHVVLEEAPAIEARDYSGCKQPNIITFSAKNSHTVSRMINQYREFLHTNTEVRLDDLCYTANSGRGSYNCRLAFTIKDIEDLNQKINKLCDADIQNIDIPGVVYSEHRVIPDNVEVKKENDINESEKKLLSVKAREKINSFLADSSIELLEELCVLYVKGADVDWEELYKGSKARKISLPVYPFEKLRCWVDIPKTEVPDKMENMHYEMRWKPKELKSFRKFNPDGAVLVFADGGIKADQLVKSMRSSGIKVIRVLKGKCFSLIDDENYYIGSLEQEYENLIEAVGKCNISYIVHMFTTDYSNEVNSVFRLKETQDNGVMSLFYLSKAIIKNNIAKKIKLFIVTKNANGIDGTEIAPENATLCGLGRVIANEYPNLDCRCIDIDDSMEESQLITEFENGTAAYLSAYRKGKRYVEEFGQFGINDRVKKDVDIKTDGVYVITGGTGGIGLQMAKFLATKNICNIALVNRTKMPGALIWDNVIAEGKNKKLCEKIKALKEIEAMGSKVECISLDIANMEEAKPAFDRLRSLYGRINGIIHAAGVAGDGFIINKSETKFREVLLPKVYGTWVLYSLIKEDNPDFFIMFSSGLSIIGQPGQGDYSAANSYLDAFTTFMKGQGMNALTINWVAWEETGMAFEHGFTGKKSLFKDINNQKAMEAFEKVFGMDIDRVFIGEIDFDSSAIEMVDRLPFSLSPDLKRVIDDNRKGKSESAKDKKTKKYSEVKIRGRENNEYSDTERKIAQICREVLGYEEIGIDDNFLDIGADSISLSRVHERIEAEYPGKITMSQIFVYPTIEKLSYYISSNEVAAVKDEIKERNTLDDKAVEDEINSLVNMLESNDLSLDDAIKLLDDI